MKQRDIDLVDPNWELHKAEEVALPRTCKLLCTHLMGAKIK